MYVELWIRDYSYFVWYIIVTALRFCSVCCNIKDYYCILLQFSNPSSPWPITLSRISYIWLDMRSPECYLSRERYLCLVISPPAAQYRVWLRVEICRRTINVTLRSASRQTPPAVHAVSPFTSSFPPSLSACCFRVTLCSSFSLSFTLSLVHYYLLASKNLQRLCVCECVCLSSPLDMNSFPLMLFTPSLS